MSYRVVPIAPNTANSSNRDKNIEVKTSMGSAVIATNPISGQLYVIGSPADVLGQRDSGSSGALSLSPSIKVTNDMSESRTPLTSTSDRRRATHNEVERRRRDTINSWIMKLGKLIPDLFNPETGPPKQQLMSKSGILARACECLTELRTKNFELKDKCRKLTGVEEENQRLHDEIAALKHENELYKRHLEANGIFIKDNDNEESDLSILP